MMTLAALCLTLLAALLAYLSSPRQNWRETPLPRPTRLVAGALWLAGTALWWLASGPGTGISAALTAAMLAWVLAPYLGWWLGRQVQRGARR